MIRLEAVTARLAKVDVTGVSLSLAAGVTAVVGATTDGAALVLALVAGAAKPSRGAARVFDLDPTDAVAKRAIGYVPLAAELPDSLRVGEVVSLAGKLRGKDAPADALSRFGLEGLSNVRVSRLTRAQARAVAFAEASSSPAVRVLVVEEPTVVMEPSVVALASKTFSADRERIVLFCTASPRDARDLASSFVMMSAGRVVRSGTAADLFASESTGSAGVRLVAFAEGARDLAAALAKEDALVGVELSGSRVTIAGTDLESAARAFGRAVVATGARVRSLSPESETPAPPGAPSS